MIKKLLPVSILLAVCALVALVIATQTATAGPANLPEEGPQQQEGVDNETCLACHAQPDQLFTMPSGELLYITVDRTEYNQSIHGELGYACVQCHTNIREYPHPKLEAQTIREASVELYPACGRCHEDKYRSAQDSVHAQALEAGNIEAAICTDCHGAHNVQDPNTPRSRSPQTCERCHSTIYAAYAESVHGSALIGQGNEDVPTCVDCHGVHNVQGPSNSPFHLFSPQICASCHTDPELMSKYGLSTNVLNSYLTDFHGTTVQMFEALAPDQETNKPVCIDCHGVHDIRGSNDPQSATIKENLLTTCRKCHPDATTNFPASWLSHYEPSPENYPVVYYVDLFYKIFIPGLLGGMGVFVITDIIRRLINRFKEQVHA